MSDFWSDLTSCVRTAKALARLHGCAGSSESLLVAYVKHHIISWNGSITECLWVQSDLGLHCLPKPEIITVVYLNAVGAVDIRWPMEAQYGHSDDNYVTEVVAAECFLIKTRWMTLKRISIGTKARSNGQLLSFGIEFAGMWNLLVASPGVEIKILWWNGKTVLQ